MCPAYVTRMLATSSRAADVANRAGQTLNCSFTASGSLAGWWVWCEAAVGCNVGEDLLDEGQDVGVFDGVDVVAALSAHADETGEAQLGQVLAHGGHAEAGPLGQRGHVVYVLGRQP